MKRLCGWYGVLPGFCLALLVSPAAASEAGRPDFAALRSAIVDLQETYSDRYPRGGEFLARLDALPTEAAARPAQTQEALERLRAEVFAAHPLLDFDRLIVLKRKRGQLGLPTNHQCNSALPQLGYENEIATLAPVAPGGRLETLFRPADGAMVGEIDLHFDARRLLFTMPNGRTWQIHELDLDSGQVRQVSREDESVDNFDACYLPDGRIVFTSTASFTAVPCWHGKERACSLYAMNADGSAMRQLCFDQDLDLHPAVLGNGQVVFSRWDYTGIMHIYLRPLMAMNPDGTLQRALYGSNSYYPNSLFFPRAIPGSPTKLVAILSGYHGPGRMGELVVLDTARGWHEEKGIVHRIGHAGEPVVPVVRDNLVGDVWPKFLHPYPLSEKYFLAAGQLQAKDPWGIYLVDVFDNVVPLAVDSKLDLFEPIPLRPRETPPVIPDRTDPARDDATVYLHDVYAGPGLAGVPRGAVKRLRIIAYHYGYPGLAGPDLIGRGGPFEAMRILGTVPVERDGSASFRVPACTPLSVQPLDAEGKALAVMRSWYTAMRGERAACVGCHEEPSNAPLTRMDLAALRPPSEIEPWYGPARGFDFEREVQPVLDRHCVGCHNGRPAAEGGAPPDLRGEAFAADYRGNVLSQLGASRLIDAFRTDAERFPPCERVHKLLGDRRTRYTPAYETLAALVRRVNVEDYVGLHVAAEYHADTSELVQMLQRGHHGVRLDAESWDRLITWIDLNAPCHGTWNDVAPVPAGADRRRRELALRYGGPAADPEWIPPPSETRTDPVLPSREGATAVSPVADIGHGVASAAAQEENQRVAGDAAEKTVALGGGLALRLVRIPAGAFRMGTDDGRPDTSPPSEVTIGRDFWMSACEITNEQFRRFAPTHFSGYFTKRSLNNDGPGIGMDGPRQPAVRVAWREAVAFCDWLSAQTGLRFTLPSEAQWEYACRAGTQAPFSFGLADADFSARANLADLAFDRINDATGGLVVLQELPHDARCDDGSIATSDVGRYAPNSWGLYDMHGNAAEWTRTADRPYPYRDDDGRNQLSPDEKRIVRGGSFHDRPQRSTSAYRLSYPAWQRVHNVGFRVVASVE